MRNRKKTALTLTACVLALSLTAGCGPKQSGSVVLYDPPAEESQEVKVSFFGYKADSINLVAIEDALYGYMDANPGVNVTYEGLKGTSYWEAFDRRANAGVMDDVVMIDHDHLYAQGAAGALADLSGLDGVVEFNDLTRSQFTNPDGSVWFLPMCTSAFGLYVNYDLLEAHGQSVPTNWEEFSQVCDYFVSQGIVPIVANNYSSMRVLIVGRGMFDVYQIGDDSAEMDRFNRYPNALAEQLRPGLEMVEEMVSRGWFDPGEVAVTAQTSDDLDLFAQGDRPFMVTGGWASPRVAAMDPGFDYGVHPLPILDDGAVVVADANTCVAVNAGSECLDQALHFVEYLFRPDILREYCESQSSHMPMEDDTVPSDKTIAPISECLNAGRYVVGSDYRLTLPLDSALTRCGAELLKGMSAADASKLLLRLLTE